MPKNVKKKFIIYSGHDTQIANVLVHMFPNRPMNGVNYADNIVFELH